ncbi:hypothetical protein TPA0908_35370 [Micromonospora sp. AKA38]|nr:hypothetical protein TPA0908_35370 [Micromonospora sp. AKA38]
MCRIRSLVTAGPSTTTIATVLPCVREDGDRLAPTCSVMLADLTQERRRILRAINDLSASRDALDTGGDHAPRLDPFRPHSTPPDRWWHHPARHVYFIRRTK